MRGSEKQIAWANEIICKISSVLEQTAAHISQVPGNEEIKAANMAWIKQRIDALQSAEYAGDVIHIFGDVPMTGDFQKDFSRLLVAYRITLPGTDGESKILCK